MSADDKKWNEFYKTNKLDKIFSQMTEAPMIFEEDKLVLTNTFEEAQDKLQEIALSKYKEVLNLATELFAVIEEITSKSKTVFNDWTFSRDYKFYNARSWTDNQNKIAELDASEVSKRTIDGMEASSERYFPELFNKKRDHIRAIIEQLDRMNVDVAHLMAHLITIVNDPDEYLVIDEDHTKGEAPF